MKTLYHKNLHVFFAADHISGKSKKSSDILEHPIKTLTIYMIRLDYMHNICII